MGSRFIQLEQEVPDYFLPDILHCCTTWLPVYGSRFSEGRFSELAASAAGSWGALWGSGLYVTPLQKRLKWRLENPRRNTNTWSGSSHRRGFPLPLYTQEPRRPGGGPQHARLRLCRT